MGIGRDRTKMKEMDEYLERYCVVCDTPFDKRYKTRHIFNDTWKWCVTCNDLIQIKGE